MASSTKESVLLYVGLALAVMLILSTCYAWGRLDGLRWAENNSSPTEQQMADYICQNPKRWYVEPTACRP